MLKQEVIKVAAYRVYKLNSSGTDSAPAGGVGGERSTKNCQEQFLALRKRRPEGWRPWMASHNKALSAVLRNLPLCQQARTPGVLGSANSLPRRAADTMRNQRYRLALRGKDHI